ncbi:MAG: PAS-domain containing protein [Rubrivivax sp.]|nr:PAS-domain containing protein [Rubrivivax sp.]
MADPAVLLKTVAETLDDLGLAMCVFDDEDRALLWNRSFLRLFPEHVGQVHVGEPYRENLRRFYAGRLGPEHIAEIDRYVDEGVQRHRAQRKAYSFEHHGRRIEVASMPLRNVGRLRMWKEHAPGSDEQAPAPGPNAAPAEIAVLFDEVPDGLTVCNRSGVVQWVNEPFVLMYGLKDRETALGLGFEEIYRIAWQDAAAEERPRHDDGAAVLAEHLRWEGAPFELPLPGERWTRVIVRRGPTGTLVQAHVDITLLKHQQIDLQRAEARARESEDRLRAKSALLEATLERMDQGVMMVNAERVVEVCNQRAIELLDLPPALMAAKPRFEDVLRWQWQNDEFVHTPDDLKEFVRAGGILDRPHRYDRRRPNGRIVEISSVPIEGGGVLRTYTDITERKTAEERMRHVARHDGLTSLVNRDAFLEAIAAQLERSRREGDGFAVHFIDLDDFKPVNDRHGHAVGDRVLAAVAERMRAVARDGDIVARMGGDEFAVMQRGVTRPEAALGLAQRLLETVHEPMRVEGVDGQAIAVGASIGVALYPGDGADVATLMRHADAAMYAAKAAGRNTVRLHAAAPDGG